MARYSEPFLDGAFVMEVDLPYLTVSKVPSNTRLGQPSLSSRHFFL